jgi:hypothetical protein
MTRCWSRFEAFHRIKVDGPSPWTRTASRNHESLADALTGFVPLRDAHTMRSILALMLATAFVDPRPEDSK